MNGKEQVERYSTLVNSDQKAPASSDWQPETLAGFRIGDHVTLPNIAATFRVIGFQHPALLILEAPSGKEVKAGWQAVNRIRTRNEIEGKS